MTKRPEFGSALILAGGQSSRMGFDKQFLSFDGERLVNHLVQQLRSHFADILLVTNKAQEHDIPGIRLIQDIYPGKGPLAGIHAGLSHSQSQYLFVIACDMPYLAPEYLRYQKQQLLKAEVDILTNQDEERFIYPFHSFYSLALLDSLEAHLLQDNLKVQRFVRQAKHRMISREIWSQFPNTAHLFLNLNTPEDVQAYLEMR